MSDMRPPCKAFASIGSISRWGRRFAINSDATPKTRPPTEGTTRATNGSSELTADNRSPNDSPKNRLCSRSTPAPISATTRPAIAPTRPARRIRLDARARITARNRRGTAISANKGGNGSHLKQECGAIVQRSQCGRKNETAKHASVHAGRRSGDVQLLAGHRSITTTQRYIDGDTDAQRRLVALI
jgi:hypothetical protein